MVKHYVRNLIFIWLVFLATKANAQRPLTNRQVYNYQVGDVMQGTNYYTETPGPPIYKTHTILDRIDNPSPEYVVYKIKQDYYRAPTCQTCSPTESTTTFYDTIRNLDSFVIHDNRTFQRAIVDVYYDSFCNRKVWAKVPGAYDSLSFEPINHETYFVEGLGGPYFKLEHVLRGITTTDFQLTYYKKGLDSCGIFMLAGISSIKTKKNFKVSPNPFSNAAVVEFPSALFDAEICIYSLQGTKVKQFSNFKGQAFSITNENLTSGVYQLVVYDKNFIGSTTIILE